jgi:hypothetical protein
MSFYISDLSISSSEVCILPRATENDRYSLNSEIGGFNAIELAVTTIHSTL